MTPSEQYRLKVINDVFAEVRLLAQQRVLVDHWKQGGGFRVLGPEPGSEAYVFALALPAVNPLERTRHLFAFMRDVSTCPEDVLRFAEGHIAHLRGAERTIQAHHDAPIACPACTGAR